VENIKGSKTCTSFSTYWTSFSDTHILQCTFNLCSATHTFFSTCSTPVQWHTHSSVHVQPVFSDTYILQCTLNTCSV